MATATSPTPDKKTTSEREGNNLLGKPTFIVLQNFRFKCVETGHELLAKDIDSYSRSKRCRLGLIDFALSNRKPPLNMFKQDPQSRSKIICKLTGDTVNKSEEHIWKHINGKRFLNKLEQIEEKMTMQDDLMDDIVEGKAKDLSKQKKESTKNKNKKEKQKFAGEMTSEAREPSEEHVDSDDADFWMPPVGERWDFDDGDNRWGSSAESGRDSDDDDDEIDGLCEDAGTNSEDISIRKKRASKEIGPSSCASKKKKSKKSAG